MQTFPWTELGYVQVADSSMVVPGGLGHSGTMFIGQPSDCCLGLQLVGAGASAAHS